MAKKPLIAVTPSSGNVFADIGVAEPEEELAKAQLASRIREVVRRSRLTQVAAAAVMGIDQPKVSALQRSPHELLERAPDASVDQARPGCRDRRQDETAPTPARAHSGR